MPQPKYKIRLLNISPKQFIGAMMLLHIFPALCFANASTLHDFTMSQALVIGYTIDLIMLAGLGFFALAFKLLFPED